MREGGLAAGTKLPPIRSVAAGLGLSPITVSAGWALLARSGGHRSLPAPAAPACCRRVGGALTRP